MIAKEVMQEDVMSKYRLSVIDDAGHVVDLYEPECVSDESRIPQVTDPSDAVSV